MTNKSLTATEAKNRFADLVDLARSEPVTITRNDKVVAIVLSPNEYARLTANDDSYWGKMAQAVQPTDFLNPEKSQTLLTNILNASDSAT